MPGLGGAAGSAVVDVVDDGASAGPGSGRRAVRDAGTRTELGGTLEIGPRERAAAPCTFPLPKTRERTRGRRPGIIRVVIVDDHSARPPGARGRPASADRRRGGGRGRETAGGGPSRRRCRPDVVLMDLQLPELQGPEATRRSSPARPETAVLVLTMFEDDGTVHRGDRAARSATCSRARTARTSRGRAFRRGRAGQCSARRSRGGCGRFRRSAVPPGTAFPAAHRPGAEILDKLGPASTNVEIGRRAVPLAQDGREQRLHDPGQAAPLPTRPGDRAGPRGRARPTRRSCMVARAALVCRRG